MKTLKSQQSSAQYGTVSILTLAGLISIYLYTNLKTSQYELFAVIWLMYFVIFPLATYYRDSMVSATAVRELCAAIAHEFCIYI